CAKLTPLPYDRHILSLRPLFAVIRSEEWTACHCRGSSSQGRCDLGTLCKNRAPTASGGTRETGGESVAPAPAGARMAAGAAPEAAARFTAGTSARVGRRRKLRRSTATGRTRDSR